MSLALQAAEKALDAKVSSPKNGHKDPESVGVIVLLGENRY